MASSLAPYPLALLELMRADRSVENPLGIARRAGVENSVFNVPAHNFLRALILYAQYPDTIAREFLVELEKCKIPAVQILAQAALSGTYSKSTDEWAAVVQQQLLELGGDITHLTQLGSHYWSHLVIAFRNPGGKKTPQDTIHPTPNIKRIEEIEELLENATNRRSQSALKDLVLLRDGPKCLLTDYSFIRPNKVTSRCAHIIPFSVHSKIQTHSAIEMFTGYTLDATTVQRYINHPRNALNLQNDAHDTMDKDLAWGIEARFSDNTWRYYYRVVRQDSVAPNIKLRDGEEILFGQSVGGSRIPLPDPTICNLHLAIARISHASGASEIFDQFLDDDDEDAFQVPVYFGGPFVSDDVLMRRLEVLAC